MERKITHYVVKPEHKDHFERLTRNATEGITIGPAGAVIEFLKDAKVLDLWCTAVYDKPRVKGWYNVYPADHMMIGPKETREEAIIDAGSGHKCIGQIFIDQEIE